MVERTIRQILNPVTYVGQCPDYEGVLLALNVGSPAEVRITFDPVAGLAVAHELQARCEGMIARHIEAVERHKRNTTAAATVKRERPERLDA